MNDGFANHGVLNENHQSSAAVTRERLRDRAEKLSALGGTARAFVEEGEADPNTPPDNAPNDGRPNANPAA
jgi:hypothetical protein